MAAASLDRKNSQRNTISHGVTSAEPAPVESSRHTMKQNTANIQRRAPNHNKGCVKNKGGHAKYNLVRTVQTQLFHYILFCPFTFPPVSKCLCIYLHIYLVGYKEMAGCSRLCTVLYIYIYIYTVFKMTIRAGRWNSVASQQEGPEFKSIMWLGVSVWRLHVLFRHSGSSHTPKNMQLVGLG